MSCFQFYSQKFVAEYSPLRCRVLAPQMQSEISTVVKKRLDCIYIHQLDVGLPSVCLTQTSNQQRLLKLSQWQEQYLLPAEFLSFLSLALDVSLELFFLSFCLSSHPSTHYLWLFTELLASSTAVFLSIPIQFLTSKFGYSR